MDIISQTILTKFFEYLLTNWKIETMIALICCFLVYFVMNKKIKDLQKTNKKNKAIIDKYDKDFAKFDSKIRILEKNIAELKNIALQMQTESDQKLLIDKIEKIIDEKLNKN